MTRQHACKMHLGKMSAHSSTHYISCQMRKGNREDVFQYDNQAWPPALSDGGRIRLRTKGDIPICLEDLSPSQTKTHVPTSIVLDGAAIIQMMKPAAAKTFDEYAQQVLVPIYFFSAAQCVTCGPRLGYL